LLFNFLTLASTFATTWNPGFSHNNHDRSAITYLLSHKYSYGYASISTALSSDYLSKWKANLLPLGCDPGSTLKMTNLFFDKSAFMSSHQPAKNTLVPIVLDEDNITISPSVCSADQIKRQLGPWERIDYLSDGSMVLLYNKVGQLPTAWR